MGSKKPTGRQDATRQATGSADQPSSRSARRGDAVPIDRRSGPVTSDRQASFTAPTLEAAAGEATAALLQQRLVSLIDLSLTLKHIHWNVVGPNFIAVHEMLDRQHQGVQRLVDELAERIATLGSVPSGLPGQVVDQRSWSDYALNRADSIAHLGALDVVYRGVIANHREAMAQAGELDQVTEDLLLGQTGELERYHWFVRSHLADWAGGMANQGAKDEMGAARAVAVKR
jgi:starvation-inducible DNA-binding protein